MLHLAIKNNKVDIVKYLLDQGVDVEKKDRRLGLTPLHTAAIAGNIALTEELIKGGADTSNHGLWLNYARMGRWIDMINYVESIKK